MRVRLLVALLLLLPASGWAQDAGSNWPKEVKTFFASREVLARIPFAPGSAILGSDGRKVLKAILPRLKELDFRVKLLRIEGQGSSGEGRKTTTTLAMLRAKAVGDYLRELLPDFDQLTLTGQAMTKDSTGEKASTNLVEVAIYDNLLNIHSAEVEQTIIR